MSEPDESLFPDKPAGRLRIYAWSPNDPPAGYSGLIKVGQTTKADVNERIREETRKGKGLIAGLGYILGLMLRSIPRTLGDFLREPARRRRVALGANRAARPVHLMAFGADFDTDEHRAESMPAPIEDFIEIEASR